MKHSTLWGRLLLWLTALLWGTSFVILKTTLDSVGVLWLLAFRFLGAALLLSALAGKRLGKLDRQTFLGSVLMGLSLAGAYLFQTYGLRYTTPGKNAFLTAIYCVLVPFLAWLFYRRRPNGMQVFSALLCFAGVGLVSLDTVEGGLNLGDFLTLVCGVFYAMQIIIMERYIRDAQGDPVAISAVQFCATAAVCLSGALLFEPFPTGLTLPVWLTLGYLSAVVTALCFFLQALGLRHTPAATASIILSFEAVFGVLSSVLFFHEQLNGKLICGFFLIFCAVILAETGEAILIRLRKHT